MLNIIIELWPYGSEEAKKTIGGFQLANDGTGTSLQGNYLYRKNDSQEWRPSVQKHHRDRDVEELVGKVLKKVYDL
jgi:uncharacterized protein (UPF0297 family)